VWKVVFANYKVTYTNNPFLNDILKDQLQDALKELKTRISNEERNKRAMLQSEEVLTQLKGMDGHAIWNVFKRWQNVINGISIPFKLHIYSSSGM
jgi:hypothetical protein